MKTRYFIYGASGHGKVIADILIKNGYEDIVFIDDDVSKANQDFYGFKISGGYQELLKDFKETDRVIIAIGINKVRKLVAKKLEETNIEFGSAIHPSAQIGKNVIICRGTVVMANSVINTDTLIGEHCIVNTSVSIDHENVIGDFVHLSPGATTGGLVNIGELTWIGLGAKIINCINIGKNSIAGAGAVVIRNIGDDSVFVGNPAKYLRKNK